VDAGPCPLDAIRPFLWAAYSGDDHPFGDAGVSGGVLIDTWKAGIRRRGTELDRAVENIHNAVRFGRTGQL
jgi:hypothetical protein